MRRLTNDEVGALRAEALPHQLEAVLLPQVPAAPGVLCGKHVKVMVRGRAGGHAWQPGGRSVVGGGEQACQRRRRGISTRTCRDVPAQPEEQQLGKGGDQLTAGHSHMLHRHLAASRQRARPAAGAAASTELERDAGEQGVGVAEPAAGGGIRGSKQILHAVRGMVGRGGCCSRGGECSRP